MKENTAHLRFVASELGSGDCPVFPYPADQCGARLFPERKIRQSDNRPVAIYHTHSAESMCRRTGGQAFGNGGIFKVGALAQALRERGVNVIHDKTPTIP